MKLEEIFAPEKDMERQESVVYYVRSGPGGAWRWYKTRSRAESAAKTSKQRVYKSYISWSPTPSYDPAEESN